MEKKWEWTNRLPSIIVLFVICNFQWKTPMMLCLRKTLVSTTLSTKLCIIQFYSKVLALVKSDLTCHPQVVISPRKIEGWGVEGAGEVKTHVSQKVFVHFTWNFVLYWQYGISLDKKLTNITFVIIWWRHHESHMLTFIKFCRTWCIPSCLLRLLNT